MEYYTLNVCGLERKLPIIQVADTFSIASFVILGDTRLVETAAQALKEKLPPVDVLITAEAKDPLTYELSKLMGMDNYYVARKSVKPYMINPQVTEVFSITTQKRQILCLEEQECNEIKGKRVAIVDDVISTGESLKAMESLVKKAGGIISAKVAILAEGDAADRSDIIFLEKLPVFPVKQRTPNRDKGV